MTNLISDYINLCEVNRIVKGISTKSGMPANHVQDVWNSVDKEITQKHTHGVVDNYKQLGSIVKSKLGVATSDDEEEKSEDSNKSEDPLDNNNKK